MVESAERRNEGRSAGFGCQWPARVHKRRLEHERRRQHPLRRYHRPNVTWTRVIQQELLLFIVHNSFDKEFSDLILM